MAQLRDNWWTKGDAAGGENNIGARVEKRSKRRPWPGKGRRKVPGENDNRLEVIGATNRLRDSFLNALFLRYSDASENWYAGAERMVRA